MSCKYNSKCHIAIAVSFAAVCLIAVIVLMFKVDNGINRMNLDYIQSFGWQVEEKPVDIARFAVPQSFDSVFSAYGKIAQSGGFDLEAHAGERVVRYSYKVLNHTDSGSSLIRINIFLAKNKIICADICSLDADGFVMPLSSDLGMVH